ncbi:YkgJ family cysteine cluster protein [bacterium]|nr:YkgJ family cysteine cluster protein [bacterium]
MSVYEENYLSKRPQELCHMCGRCCRVVTTSKPYFELLKLKADGDVGACEFLKIFKPFASIDEARAVDKELVDNIVEKMIADGNYDKDKLTFYTCKYLQKDNLCGIYEERPDLCRHCPSTPWVIVPPGCGFEGWLFMEREKIKAKIRKAKEDLLEMKVLKSKNQNEETLKKIEAVEAKIQGTIDLYKKYGSYDW